MIETDTRPLQILVADDDPVSRSRVIHQIGRLGHQAMECEDGLNTWSSVHSSSPPDMIIMDWNMPGMTGVEVCRRIRQKKSLQYTYIIMLTARCGHENIVEGMESGADDFISKPFMLEEFKVRLRAGERIIRLNRQMRRAHSCLELLASRDPLTGLWNRAYVLNFLEKELARSVRNGTNLFVALMDVDHFKRINDTLGHPAGDVVLKEMADRLQAALREQDYVGRFGGEEFLLILTETGSSLLEQVACRYVELISSKPYKVERKELFLSASFGWFRLEPGKDFSVKDIIRKADGALYKAKSNGRNRYEIAENDEHIKDLRA